MAFDLWKFVEYKMYPSAECARASSLVYLYTFVSDSLVIDNQGERFKQAGTHSEVVLPTQSPAYGLETIEQPGIYV